MKKYSGVALHVIVFVFLFIFLRIFSEYHFYCVEQNQLFQLTPIFIIDKLMQPGGLAMVLSGCLVQFFILPNVGAMITAALLTSLGALFWAILKRIDPRSHGILWAWLPVLSLLFVQWDFNYRFQGTVAFGMMLLALYRFRDKEFHTSFDSKSVCLPVTLWVGRAGLFVVCLIHGRI